MQHNYACGQPWIHVLRRGTLRPIHRPLFLQRDASVIMARKKSVERPPRATTLAALAFSKSIASYVDLKALQTPVPVHRPRRFCTDHLCVAPHCHAATHFASDARCIAFGERQSHMACGLHEPPAHASLPLLGSASLHAPRAPSAKRIDAHTQAPRARRR